MWIAIGVWAVVFILVALAIYEGNKVGQELNPKAPRWELTMHTRFIPRLWHDRDRYEWRCDFTLIDTDKEFPSFDETEWGRSVKHAERDAFKKAKQYVKERELIKHPVDTVVKF